MIETVVYYTIQRSGSFGVTSSPVNRRWEKEIAEKQALQTVKLTMGDLQIVMFICDEKVTDSEVYQQSNFLKRAAIGMQPGFHMSEYTENESGEGFVNEIPEADWTEDEE